MNFCLESGYDSTNQNFSLLVLFNMMMIIIIVVGIIGGGFVVKLGNFDKFDLIQNFVLNIFIGKSG